MTLFDLNEKHRLIGTLKLEIAFEIVDAVVESEENLNDSRTISLLFGGENFI